MLPFQRNKVDISKLTPQEQQLFAKYGKLPTHKNMLMKMQKERKYFDSGDYALSKAGVTPQSTVGTAIPNPENIPHASPANPNGHQAPSVSPTTSTSPVNRESSLSQINTKPPESEGEAEEEEAKGEEAKGEEAKGEEAEGEEDIPDKAARTEFSTSEIMANPTVEAPAGAVQATRIETQQVEDIDMAV